MKVKILLASLLIAAFFYSCKSLEKQRSAAQKFYQEHPAELAAICADKFPPKIEFRPGKPVIVPGDTIRVQGPTLECPETITTDQAIKRVKLQCPESRIIRDTILIVDSFFAENTARVSSLQYRLDTTGTSVIILRDKLAKTKATSNAQILWIVVLLLLLAGGILLRVKKFI